MVLDISRRDRVKHAHYNASEEAWGYESSRKDGVMVLMHEVMVLSAKDSSWLSEGTRQ